MHSEKKRGSFKLERETFWTMSCCSDIWLQQLGFITKGKREMPMWLQRLIFAMWL